MIAPFKSLINDFEIDLMMINENNTNNIFETSKVMRDIGHYAVEIALKIN